MVTIAHSDHDPMIPDEGDKRFPAIVTYEVRTSVQRRR
jgi:hypothetical protein